MKNKDISITKSWVKRTKFIRVSFILLSIQDWNFKMDGILHNTSQDDTYDTVARDAVTGAMDGYNGEV